MLSVFCDESSDETEKRVFALAGVIGTEDLWEKIESKWVVRTKGIPFHANDCDSDHGNYKNTPHLENKNLYRDLVVMLADSGLGGWGFAIDLSAQRRVFPDAPNIVYYKCFVEVLQAMNNCAANNGETAKYTFDMRSESEHNARLLYEIFKTVPESVVPAGLSFASSKEQPRLQIADLFAREVMKTYDNRFGPKARPVRRSWTALRNTGRFHIEAIGNDWFEDLERQMPMLKEQTGQSKENYLEWLAEHRLQHSNTNIFRYIGRKAAPK